MKPGLTLTRQIGRGGMGSIWVARHAALKADVAIKFLSPGLVERPEAIERFSFEAAAAARIKSPHAVNVHDYGVLEDELPYLVMELLDGEDLGKRIDREGALALDQVTTILIQLARVLTRAHELDIIHRDIKPDNVFLLEGYGDLFIKLIDFGIAKLVTEQTGLTETGLIVGTPDYMCPEQFSGARDVGPPADIWGSVAVAYHALTGVKPFPGDTLPSIIFAIDRGEYAPPFEEFGIGTPALDDFFRRAFDKDPKKRFAHFDELVGAWKSAIGRSLQPKLGSNREPVDASSIPTRGDLPQHIARGALEDARSDASSAEVETAPSLPLNRSPASGRRLFVSLSAAAVLLALLFFFFSSQDSTRVTDGSPGKETTSDNPEARPAATARDRQPEQETPPIVQPSPPPSPHAKPPVEEEPVTQPSRPEPRPAPAPLPKAIPEPKPPKPRPAPAAPPPTPQLKDRGF